MWSIAHQSSLQTGITHWQCPTGGRKEVARLWSVELVVAGPYVLHAGLPPSEEGDRLIDGRFDGSC
jgi:hypothetical protein